MIKTFAAALALSVVAYILWATTDTITWFAREAAALALLSVRVCGGLLIVLVATGATWLLLRQQYERNRQRDGAFALREYWLEPLPRRLLNWLAGRPSARVVYDPNANMSHAAVISEAVFAVEPAAGWGMQAAYAADIERTRRVQAAAPGDGVLSLPWASVGQGIGGVANAATGRFLAGAYDKTPRPLTVDSPPPAAPQLPPPPDLTPSEAIASARPAEIVLGQTDRGELVRWNMAQTPHLRFHGTTQGSGKTNAIQAVAAGALHTGAHVVICDRVDFKDWGDFTGRAELVDTADPAALADVTARLLTIYHNRTRQLAKAGVKNIAAHGRMQRVVVIISEFGAQMDTARAAGMGAEVEGPLIELARLAGSTGIHLIAEDQAVKGWHRMLTTNLIPAIGYMPLYAAQACGWQGRGKVTPETFPLGTFWFGGRTFAAPHMEPELRTLLSAVPAPRQLVMLTPPWEGSSQPVHSGSSQPVHGPVHGYSPEVAPPPPAAVNTTNTTPATVEGWYEWTLDNYLPAHPELLQTDGRGRGMGVQALAETMATENGKTVDAMRGTASEVAKRIRETASLPSGARFGTDISGSAQ